MSHERILENQLFLGYEKTENSRGKNYPHINDLILFQPHLYNRTFITIEPEKPLYGAFIQKKSGNIKHCTLGTFSFDNDQLNKITVARFVEGIKQGFMCADFRDNKKIKEFMETNDIQSYFIAEIVREDHPIEPAAIIKGDNNSTLYINMDTIERPPIIPYPNNQKK